MTATNQMTIENAFSYHAPKGNQTDRYQQIRSTAKELANLIDKTCPDSEEKRQALNMLRTSVMWANAAIACNE